MRLKWSSDPWSTLCSRLILLPLGLALLSTVVADNHEREFKVLTDPQLQSIVDAQDPTKAFDLKNPSSHLSKILIPRAPDTNNITLVRNHIVATLRALKWDVEEDLFTDETPYGRKRFTNIIATKDPLAPRRIVVSAHYDSKFFEGSPMNQFVGATDSAMPCALMLDLAESLNPYLEARKRLVESGNDLEEEEAAETTLQLIFFDGEEAFKDWTDTDSTYGSRHLAERWEHEYMVQHPQQRLRRAETILNSIDHLILLDLLGAAEPSIQSYFLSTAWMFDGLIDIEKRLNGANLAPTQNSFFIPRTGLEHNDHGIGDDHIPFLNRGVSILHLIANPFPRVWHRLQDDGSALDMPTMKKWGLLMRVFIAEYLGLQPGGKHSPRTPSATPRSTPRDELSL